MFSEILSISKSIMKLLNRSSKIRTSKSSSRRLLIISSKISFFIYLFILIFFIILSVRLISSSASSSNHSCSKWSSSTSESSHLSPASSVCTFFSVLIVRFRKLSFWFVSSFRSFFFGYWFLIENLRLLLL